MNPWLDPKLALSGILIALFAAAYFVGDAPDQMMKGAMIAAFSSAYGYWLGSSSGSARKTDMLADPGKVEVVNGPDDPVPVETEK